MKILTMNTREHLIHIIMIVLVWQRLVLKFGQRAVLIFLADCVQYTLKTIKMVVHIMNIIMGQPVSQKPGMS